MIKRCKVKFLICILIMGFFLPFRFTVTNSVTPRIFYISHNKDIKNGDYILFKRNQENISNLPFIKETIKQVTGIAGDKVEVNKKEFFINGQSMGFAKIHSKQGKALAIGPSGIIPPGFLFVHGSSSNSLDSRYAAMGWINEANVVRAIPLW